MSKPGYLDVVLCKPREGASEQDVRRLSAELQRWVERQPGFVRRRLLHDAAKGMYVDLVEWDDRGSAERAMASGHPDAAIGDVLQVESMVMLQTHEVSLP